VTLFGVDVSRYQGPVDWPAVAAGGVSFATIKASEGAPGQTTSGSRDYWRSEYPRAARSGLMLGAYLVVRSGPAKPQVDWFLEQLAAVGADPAKLILQLDFEEWSYDFPSYADLKAVVVELRHRTNRTPILYTGHWIWERLTDAPVNAATDLGVALWDSYYTQDPLPYRDLYARVPAQHWAGYGGWAAPSILQFSSVAQVPGVSGPADVNAYRGSLDDLKTLLLGEADDMSTSDLINVPALGGMPASKATVGDALGYALARSKLDLDADTGEVLTLAKVQATLTGVAAGVSTLKAAQTAPVVPEIDYDKLAAAIAGKFPPLPTAAEVADELSKRLAQ